MHKIVAIAALLLSAACATTPQVPLPPAPTCTGDADCTAKWDAAQLFVVKNAGMKIQIATNVLIETYNSTGSSTELAMQVTREPLGGGRFKLAAKAWCANIFGCSRKPADVMREFVSYINAIQP